MIEREMSPSYLNSNGYLMYCATATEVEHAVNLIMSRSILSEMANDWISVRNQNQ